MIAEKKKPKILIVDDTPENLNILQELLEKNYQVFATTKGVIALQITKKQLPDLILLDVLMPEMDGYEVCRNLKADEITKEIPIIFITAKSEIEDEIKGFEAGGVDYIAKPFKPAVVMARVQSQMALKREKELLKENMRLHEEVNRITHHDLKSPLTSIIGYPRLIDKSNLTDKQKEILEKISLAGYRLLNMINLSLDLYKMEKGTYNCTHVPVNIISIINDIFKDLHTLIKIKKITTEIIINDNAISEGDQFKVQGEELLFYSLLSNLIKNAFEASPLTSKLCIKLNNKENISITINNQGSVPEEIREIFFEKFSTFGKKDGTGLGTYSAKLITETMGGNISMSTSEENGTTVSIVFLQETK